MSDLIYLPNYESLESKLAGNISVGDLEFVRRAYDLAETAHYGQTRDEGTPYIIHPLRVAISLVDELNERSPTLISSALMHDVIEDSDVTREDIADLFGHEVAKIVWLLTKLEEIPLPNYLAAIEEASESGAPLVKLCDRLDNLRFLSCSPRMEKKYRYIASTETYYLPLAERTDPYLYEELRRWLEVIRQAE